MKILQVNVNGKYGSTGKITTDIHEEMLRRGHESLVCYGANATIEDNNYYRICSDFERHLSTVLQRLHGVSYGYYAFNGTHRLIRKIKSFKPDVVHLQCVNGCIVDIYRLLHFLAKNRIKTVVTLHAEFMHTGSCGHALDCIKWREETGCHHCEKYKHELHSLFDNTHFSWKKMSEAFNEFDENDIIITSVSPWLKDRAQQSPFLKRFHHEVVMNGLNDSVFQQKQVSADIRQRFDTSKKILLFVSASFDQNPMSHKGGWYFVELAKQMPEHQFCIVASYFRDTENLPSNVILWGRTQNQEELADLYNLADVSVITSKRETFSMVTAESLCCGTPVVGFEAGGPESIAPKQYSKFVTYGNIRELHLAINQILQKEHDASQMANEAKVLFSKSQMTDNYISIYKKIG